MTLATSTTSASVHKSPAAHGAAAASSAAGSASGPAGAADAFAALLQGLCGDSAAAGVTTLAPDSGAAVEDDTAAAAAGGAGELAADTGLAALTDLAQAQATTPAAPPHLPAATAADAAQNLPGLAALLQAAQAHEQRPGRRAGGEASGAKGATEAVTQDPARPGAGKAMPAAAAPDALIDPAAAAPAATVPAGGAFAAALAQQSATERAETREPAAHAGGLAELTSTALPTHDPSAQLAAAAAPTGPMHQAALPSHPLDQTFGGELAAEVKVMVEGGVQQAELHLNPADLGPIRIQLSLNAQTADISFAAAHSLTREGLAQALPSLREMLAGQGLSLGQAGVSSGGSGDASAFQPPQREARTPRGDGARSDGAAGLAGLAPAATTLRLRPGRGMLDLYA